jgi:2-polyprenyl-3-methyl-5-hydroxy-6-metoxy-1,4-benzoquinol methylase/MoaA/NifB/PqqE/SkfB family radical SAM enzyme
METFQISDIISNGDFGLQSRDTLSVLWAVTRACNFNCSYCTYSRDFKLADEIFSTKEDLLRAGRKLLGLNRPGYQITLYGGEPTFHPNFLDLLTFLGESQAPISLRMFTNGSRSPSFFEQVFALSKGLPFGVIFSLHLERARFDNFKKVVEIAVNAGTSAGVSLMIDPKWREESKRYAEELLALCRKAPFFMNIVIPYAPGGIMGGECTAEDHVWIKQVREEFARISVPAHLKSPFFTRIQSNITLNRDGGPVSLAPEDSLQLLSKSETPSYRNFYCCGGTNVWFLAPDGTVSGGVCESARPLFNIFRDPMLEIVSKMAVVRCTAPACNSIENIPLPKFRCSEDAESCIADFKERAMAYYLLKPVRPELAMVHSELHHTEADEAAQNHAPGLRPNDPTALKLLADTKRDKGLYQEAGIIYGKLINHHPDQSEILLSLAECFCKLGDREGAQAALEHVLALDPGNVIARDNLASLKPVAKEMSPILLASPNVAHCNIEGKMNYASEYTEYWSRPDRWGSHSFDDPNVLANQIERTCGRGSLLDVGCGMGLLVRTLVSRGIDAHGTDIAHRVIEEGNRELTGRFHAGSILSLPFPDSAFETVCSTDCLEHLAEADVPQALHELYRVCRRFAFIRLATMPDRDGRWHLTIKDRIWWETRFFEAGFRKHSLCQQMTPFETLKDEGWQITLLLERIPASALLQYPLGVLNAERDLHMDMLREMGIRSEAHLARYQLAAAYAKDGDVIVDAACGLGYGSAMLTRQFPKARVVGVDNSDFAIAYAQANYASVLPNLEFHRADVCDLQMLGERAIDLLVSFETIEHVPEPERFLDEAIRRMNHGGVFIGSVPNLWLDETGKDPNPWHFHVFDLPKFYQLCAGYLNVSAVYRQNAGGGLRNPNSDRVLRQVQLPVTDQLEEAEWWIIAAQKPPALLSASASKPRVCLIDGPSRGHFYAELKSALDCEWSSGLDGDLDLAIVSDEWCTDSSLVIQQLKRRGVPTLHVVDGVVDWNNTWENPRSLTEDAGLPLFQPILCDKVACLGQLQARVFSAWGNADKCEIVGAPRFDRYYSLKRRARPADAPARILVMTANTPYFNEDQHQAIRYALQDLRDSFAAAGGNGGGAIEVVWRLTRGLEAEIGVKSTSSDFTGKELAELLVTVDAVICSPSTALLEAMLLGLPTALLDYSNVPHYLQPAWQITSPTHIARTLSELVKPPASKMLHQEMVLHDALECASPATPRLAALVAGLIEQGRQAKGRGAPPVFPPGMVPVAFRGNTFSENRHSLSQLYPGHTVFRIDNPAELQAELGHWRKSARALRQTELPSALPVPPPAQTQVHLTTFATATGPIPASTVPGSGASTTLAAFLQRASQSAAGGHKVLAELVLEEALENFPYSKEAMELQQELRTTGTIRKRIAQETPALPTSAVNEKRQSGQDSPRPPRLPYKEFFASLDWRPDRMVMSGLEFFLQHAVDATGGKRGQGFLFYKTLELVQQYQEYFEKLESFSPEHVFEIGLWDGGSAVFWHECFHPQKHVAIDIQARTDCIGLDRYRAESGTTGSLVTHWQTDQSDTTRLREIVEGELGNRLDLVIDDASHLYRQTRASFEALFPFLRPRGMYIIEDWAWGHWLSFQAADHPWKDEIPLTRLITELVEIVGGSDALVRSVDVRQGFVAVTRGAAPIERSANLRLEAVISRKAVWF